ncbi:Beclin-2 [Manis javanica]|nr:Beclin-2 [Manis javanica]
MLHQQDEQHQSDYSELEQQQLELQGEVPSVENRLQHVQVQEGQSSFLYNKFDRAMTAFLNCMQQFKEDAEKASPTSRKPTATSLVIRMSAPALTSQTIAVWPHSYKGRIKVSS